MVWSGNKAPDQEGEDGKALAAWVEDELERFANDQLDNMQAVDLRPIYASPLRPREGMIIYADGSSWDPGSGAGVYAYGADGLWKPLQNAVIPAWAAYTSVGTPDAGAFASTTISARARLDGPTVFFNIKFVIAAAGIGTATGTLSLTAPYNLLRDEAFACMEMQSLGVPLYCRGVAGGTQIQILSTAGSSPLANSRTFIVSGSYEKG